MVWIITLNGKAIGVFNSRESIMLSLSETYSTVEHEYTDAGAGVHIYKYRKNGRLSVDIYHLAELAVETQPTHF